MAFCRSMSIYISNKPEVEVKIGEIKGVEVEMLLSLIKVFAINSSLPTSAEF